MEKDYRKIALDLAEILIGKAPETRKDVEEMLHELRESEDERIRDWLKSLRPQNNNKWNNVSVTPKFPCNILFRYPNGNMFIFRYLEGGKKNDATTPMFSSLEAGEWIYLDDVKSR